MDRARALRPIAALGVLGLFGLLTAWALWPLPRAAAEALLDARRYYGRGGWLLATDAWLCQWILAWDTHALGTNPIGLFDANIFHPAPQTLALSEHLLGYWPLFAPVWVATGNPALAYNATLLSTFVLSGAAMCWLVWHWTGRLAGALLAGVVFAFAPWRLSQLGHMHLLGLYGAPLVLLFWDRALATGRARHVVGVFVAFVVQCLCSYYLAYCTVVIAAVYVACTAPGADRRHLGRATAALGVAGLALAMTSLPYLWVRQHGLITELPLGLQAAHGVRSWRHYLTPLPLGPAIEPFQGRMALALAALGALAPLAGGRPRGRVVLALVLIGVVGGLLAAGPHHDGLYAALWHWLPGFSATRVPARFLVVLAFAVAALAGVGWGVVTHRLGPRARVLATAAVSAAILWEVGLPGLRIPLEAAPTAGGVPTVYRWLARHGDGRPLLELPVRRGPGDLAGAATEQRYALFSTIHWLPQLTGRSGYTPPSHDLLMSLARSLPEAAALQWLVDLTGLGWIVVHGERADEAGWRMPGLELVATFGRDRVHRVTLAPRPGRQDELVARLLGRPERTSLGGVPLHAGAPLEAEIVAWTMPERVRVGRIVSVHVTMRNAGRAPWPGLVLDAARGIVLRAAWRRETGEAVLPRLAPTRPPGDVEPGATVRFVAGLHAPRAPGRYHLALTLAHGARRLPLGDRGLGPIEVRAP